MARDAGGGAGQRRRHGTPVAARDAAEEDEGPGGEGRRRRPACEGRKKGIFCVKVTFCIKTLSEICNF